ncbi:LLM class oxidoreductase [Nocardioides sambongensis]|uniref:LLM class flavin-dependent oxidoreductase n=1 Tax=Nocardioides sambongensis TaxID=2589074 RepID=UPI001E446CD1|nr:LLM class flavin-dependent oxidoreductase [Nocardioides sambongensis]
MPILVGGHSEAALARAARIGDGWISANLAVDDLERDIARLGALRADLGRTGPFTVCATPVSGAGVAGLRRLGAAGATDVYLSPTGFLAAEGRSVGSRIDAVRRFADEIIDPLR